MFGRLAAISRATVAAMCCSLLGAVAKWSAQGQFNQFARTVSDFIRMSSGVAAAAFLAAIS
jgi:hypothetical protein